MKIWWNGHLMNAANVRVSPLDRGFLVGDGVFETLISIKGHPYAVRRHWQRLRDSCAAMELRVMSEEVFRQGMIDVVTANELSEARIRVTLTGGEGLPGTGRGHLKESICMTAVPVTSWPEIEHLVASPWPRLSCGALTGIKSISYAENVRALAFAQRAGCGEALFANEQGEVCEGTGSNIFWVRHGRVETPPLSSGCLAGVTRSLVLELASRLGLPVVETRLPLADLLSNAVDEVFLTSSTRNVQPVGRIDSSEIASPGPVTTRLQHAFEEWQHEEVDP